MWPKMKYTSEIALANNYFMALYLGFPPCVYAIKAKTEYSIYFYHDYNYACIHVCTCISARLQPPSWYSKFYLYLTINVNGFGYYVFSTTNVQAK